MTGDEVEVDRQEGCVLEQRLQRRFLVSTFHLKGRGRASVI